MDPKTYPPRRAKKGAAFGYTGPDGVQRELVADAHGIVQPETAHDVEILDGFGLPIARTAKDTEPKPVPTKPDTEPRDVPRETTSKPAETGAEG